MPVDACPTTENTTIGSPARDLRDRLARVLTELFAPWVIVVLLPLAVAWRATHRVLPALGWGLLVAATSSILPMAVIVWGARTGRWDGHHVRDRAGRLVPLIALIVMSLVGLGLLVALGAPRQVIVLDVAMIASLLVTGGITARWKISMHSAVASGAVVILAVTYHPVCWALMVLVAAISWSRVQVRDHTTAQVVLGALIGAAVGGGLFAALG
ncbi:phosphatase PAP2 family protein [Saccharopolyspora ipomoeae]|uniref:phosphatase PAP2 family protein n=1 Tax=Saccharopolyspora ipomoeae TaxID=3042027 RepID=UPI003CCF0AAF